MRKQKIKKQKIKVLRKLLNKIMIPFLLMKLKKFDKFFIRKRQFMIF